MVAATYADEIDIQHGFISELIKPSKQASMDEVEKQTTILLDIEVAIDGLIKGKRIALPLFDKEYQIYIDKTYPGSEDVVTYAGNVYLESQKESVGDILLTHGGGLVYGLISTEGNVFQILPNSEDKATDYSLQKMKQIAAEGFTDFETKLDDYVEDIKIKSENELGLMPEMARAASCCQVDVLVLFTHRVRSRHGGTTATRNWVNTIIASYNQKLAEVGLGGYSFRLKSAQQINYSENITNNSQNACVPAGFGEFCDSIIADQHWLITNGSVANLRNQYSADLMALITSNGRKHSSDKLHGVANWKQAPESQLHGGACGNADRCGEFITVRDTFALSNLTFHHEAGHALGMRHIYSNNISTSNALSDGARTFGVNNNNPNGQTPNSTLKTPFTIMQVNYSSPICLWSSNSASSYCEVRLPFYADKYQYRSMYYTGFVDPRKFDPTHHVEDNIVRGFSWLANRR
jgi:hypothetical protein